MVDISLLAILAPVGRPIDFASERYVQTLPGGHPSHSDWKILSWSLLTTTFFVGVKAPFEEDCVISGRIVVILIVFVLGGVWNRRRMKLEKKMGFY